MSTALHSCADEEAVACCMCVCLVVQERRIICDALTREVVRVHKQLQHAAATLKGPAQLPALQAWDTAFAKVGPAATDNCCISRAAEVMRRAGQRLLLLHLRAMLTVPPPCLRHTQC